MVSFNTAWQAIGGFGLFGTACEVGAIAGRTIASNSVIEFGACCTNMTQAIERVACSRLNMTSTNADDICFQLVLNALGAGVLSVLSTICVPISLSLSVGGITFRYIGKKKEQEQNGEIRSLLAQAPRANTSTARKIAGILSSKAAQITYASIGLISALYTPIGSIAATNTASNLGVCTNNCSALTTQYQILSTLFTTAQSLVPVIIVIGGIAYAYDATKPKDPPSLPPQAPEIHADL